MKMDKTKAIISTLAVALVITTSLAILNVTRINNDKKKGAAADMQSEQTLTQTLTKESEKTTQENIEETTAEPKKAVAKAPQKSAETTQTTAPTEDIIIPQNQVFADDSGNTITFNEIRIRKDEFILVRFKHERENSNNQFFAKGYDMTYTDDKGNTMGKPDGYRVKYLTSELSGAMLAYDPNVTSITVSYTFPDGTNASAVLNLK